MLQAEEPDDCLIVGTGRSHSVRDFLAGALSVAGFDWKDYLIVDERLFRLADIHELRANAQKAKLKLGWNPTVFFPEIVRTTVEADCGGLSGIG